MKKLVQVVFSLALLVCINGYAQTKEEKARISNVSKKMSSLFAKLGPGMNEVNMNWKENPEVAEVLAYPTIKRIAAVNLLIWGLKENDEKMFLQLEKNQNQLATSIITRIFAFTFLKEFVKATPDDIGMKDFLDGEIADLTLTISQKIPYGIYAQSRKQRSDKLTYLYMTNKDFVEAMLRLKTEASPIEKLTNKTTGVAVFQTCMQNMELCEKL